MDFKGFEWLKSKFTDKSIGGNGMTWTAFNANNVKIAKELTEDNGYDIATNVGEVFIPIDIIAEKVSKLFDTLKLVSNSGKDITMPKNIQRLIKTPNIYTSGISDLIYNYIFSELSDGNGYLYAKCITDAQKITVDNVQQLYWLESDKVDIKLKGDERDYLKAAVLSDYIEYYEYTKTNDRIKPEFILHSKVSGKYRGNNTYKAQSPLYSAQSNINNLLASYSARYNSFVNNGTSGYLCPESGNLTTQDIVNKTTSRQKILDDINERNGITGNRNFWGISSTPLKFVNTLGTIKDLMPYEESLANFLIVAGIYGVDKDLLPLKEGTTFTNKEVAEAKVWSDIAITYANDICTDLTNLFGLTDSHFEVESANVGFLESKRKVTLESDKIEIENIKTLIDSGLFSDQEVKVFKMILIDKYGNKEK